MNREAEATLRTYVAEWYSPRRGDDDREGRSALLRRAARRSSRRGQPVSIVGSLELPADETALCLVRSESRAAIEAVLSDAGIVCERITEAALGDLFMPVDRREFKAGGSRWR